MQTIFDKFTFYYIYIKTSVCPSSIFLLTNLHSTIFILKQKKQEEFVKEANNLHSTIFILKQVLQKYLQIQGFHPHICRYMNFTIQKFN